MWPDLFIANDTQPNKLYRNNGNGTFVELGLQAGLAFSEEGLEDARRSFEREFLIARLAEHGWNISRTAEAIGIARESLSRKIKTYGIEVEKG